MRDKALIREAIEIMVPNSSVTWDCFQDQFSITLKAYGVGELAIMLKKSYPYRELEKENAALRRALFDLVPPMIYDGDKDKENA